MSSSNIFALLDTDHGSSTSVTAPLKSSSNIKFSKIAVKAPMLGDWLTVVQFSKKKLISPGKTCKTCTICYCPMIIKEAGSRRHRTKTSTNNDDTNNNDYDDVPHEFKLQDYGYESWSFQACTHGFCRPCYAMHVQTHIKDRNMSGLKCPEPMCKKQIPVNDIKSLLGSDKKLYKEYEELRNQKFDNRLDDVLDESIQDEDMKSFRQFLEDSNAMSCPKCNILLLKVDGCSEITCTCGLSICYNCCKSTGRCSCHVKCYNCNQMGHISKDCVSDKIKCSTCSKFHSEFVVCDKNWGKYHQALNKKANSNRKRRTRT